MSLLLDQRHPQQHSERCCALGPLPNLPALTCPTALPPGMQPGPRKLWQLPAKLPATTPKQIEKLNWPKHMGTGALPYGPCHQEKQRRDIHPRLSTSIRSRQQAPRGSDEVLYGMVDVRRKQNFFAQNLPTH